MKIEVTADDIANGKPGFSCECPIALALRRLFPDAGHIEVEMADVHIDYDMVELPDEARDFIEHFDAEDEVSPFSFEIEGLEDIVCPPA